MKLVQRKQSKWERSEHWRTACDVIARATVTAPDGALRLDRKRLDDGERADLAELVDRACNDEGGFDPHRLDRKDAERLEALAEKGAGRPPGSVWQHARDMSELQTEMAKLAREVRKPPRRPLYEEEGSIRMPKLIWDGINRPTNPAYEITTLGVYAFLMLCIENGTALSPQSWVEGQGDEIVLCLDARYGLGARYTGDVYDWQFHLNHLATTKWLNVERTGQTIRVSRGVNALNALKAVNR